MVYLYIYIWIYIWVHNSWVDPRMQMHLLEQAYKHCYSARETSRIIENCFRAERETRFCFWRTHAWVYSESQGSFWRQQWSSFSGRTQSSSWCINLHQTDKPLKKPSMSTQHVLLRKLWASVEYLFQHRSSSSPAIWAPSSNLANLVIFVFVFSQKIYILSHKCRAI